MLVWSKKKDIIDSAVSEEWKEAKRLSVYQKQQSDLYTKLMYSYGYKINNRDYIYNNVPYYINENGDAVFDETNLMQEGVFWETLQPEEADALSGTTSLISRFSGTSESEEVAINVNLPQNIEEDYTINEIIDQKQLAFTESNFSLELADPIKKKIEELRKKLVSQAQSKNNTESLAKAAEGLRTFIDGSIDEVSKAYKQVEKRAGSHLRNAKWYPYSGWVYIPVVWKRKVSGKIDEGLSFRRIDVSPFNLDIDPSKNVLEDADFINVAERLTFPSFYRRYKNGEFSELSKSLSQDELMKIWNEEEMYEFLPKNFPDVGLSRSTSLRWNSYASTSNGTNSLFSESDNAYGVIDYYLSKQLDGSIILYTLLNGKEISKLKLEDYGIDMYPIILFSEDQDVKNNMDYAGNLAFRLLSSSLRIQINNKKIAETENDMEPVVIFQYVKDNNRKESHLETTELVRGQGQNLYLIYSDKPESANNTSRIDAGANYYTSFIKELEELNLAARQAMKESAGITDFLAGTDSHSMQTKSGLSDMIAAGLKAEADIVKSHSATLSEAVTMETFFMRLQETVKHNSKVKSKEKAIQISTLSTVVEALTDMFVFSLESEYARTQTNSVITNLLVPLSAQTKQVEALFDFVKMLPVTKELKDFLDTIQDKVAALKQKEVDDQKDLETHKAGLSSASEEVKMAAQAALQQLIQKKEAAPAKKTAAKKTTTPKKTAAKTAVKKAATKQTKK